MICTSLFDRLWFGVWSHCVLLFFFLERAWMQHKASLAAIPQHREERSDSKSICCTATGRKREKDAIGESPPSLTLCSSCRTAGEQNTLLHEEKRRGDPPRSWKNQCKGRDFKIGRVAEGPGGSGGEGGRVGDCADMEINNSGAFRAAWAPPWY